MGYSPFYIILLHVLSTIKLNSLTCMTIIIMYAAPSNVVVNISEFFGINTVTTTLEWTQEYDVIYNVSVFPPVTNEMSEGSSFELTLLYNTYYNVSVVATRCGKSNTNILLHYGKIMHSCYNC